MFDKIANFLSEPLVLIIMIVLLLGATQGAVPFEPFLWDWSDIGGSLREFGAWTLGLGKPLAIGLLALATTLGVVGYFVTELAWRAYIVLAWRSRARRRR